MRRVDLTRVQSAIDSKHENVIACQNHTLKYRFNQTYHGCNEVVAGNWKYTDRGLRVQFDLSYEEALEHMKNNTKIQPSNVIYVNFKREDS